MIFYLVRSGIYIGLEHDFLPGEKWDVGLDPDPLPGEKWDVGLDHERRL